MRKKIIVKLLVLSLLVGGLSQWSGGSKAKAASSYWLWGTVLTKKVMGIVVVVELKCIIVVEN